jgi:hypothetical protein
MSDAGKVEISIQNPDCKICLRRSGGNFEGARDEKRRLWCAPAASEQILAGGRYGTGNPDAKMTKTYRDATANLCG